jgi:hypothetical protein
MRTTTRLVTGVAFVAALAFAGSAYAQAGGDRGGSGGGGGGSHSSGTGGGGGSVSSGGASGGSYSGGASSSGSTSTSSGSGGGGGTSPGGYTGGGFGGARGNGGGAVRGTSPMGGVRGVGGARSDGGAVMVRETGRNVTSADPTNAAIPGGARPNHTNPAVGTAVVRGTVPATSATGGGGNTYYTNTSNTDWYWNDSYGSSSWYLNRRFYPSLDCDSLMLGMPGCWSAYGIGYDPWSSSFGFGYPFGMMGYPGWESASGGSAGESTYYSDSPAAQRGPKGGLKLKVNPKAAEVYVDNYYLGRVDDYNGAFQRLELPVGLHKIELRATGYESVNFEVKIEARDIVTYRGAMQSLQPPK